LFFDFSQRIFVELFGSSCLKEDFHAVLICLTLNSFRATLADPAEVRTEKAVCGFLLGHTSCFAGKETPALDSLSDHFDFFFRRYLFFAVVVGN
jgi:hypothetical protein